MAAALRDISRMDADYFRVFTSEEIYRWKGDVRGHPRGPYHTVARPGAPPYGVATSVPSSVSALDFVSVLEKIVGLAFVSSNSENISFVKNLE
jgi:hypothetical protein